MQKILIKFSNDHNLRVNWELGNGKHSGEVVKCNTQFLKNGVRPIDAITWHQYYINGRTVVGENFLDPEVFDLLKSQILQIRKITQPYNIWNKPIWLGETSSAYCGEPQYYQIHLSDWWMLVLYKNLLGLMWYCAYTACLPKVRLYSHCTKRNVIAGNPTSITVFGFNMGNSSANIRIEGLYPHEYELNTDKDALLTTVYAFEITAKDSLFSHMILLNGRLLKMSRNNTRCQNLVPKVISLRPFVTMLPLSSCFLVIPSPRVRACYL
ncbi:hypothetical protein NQ317_015555 [Molorchus minor]|uniref:Uncharacterized protein n=1 Tax=Molorchus minor TaxID=1323400 RepID=A0ABQ9ITZ5_9CUCU|nr:hypothetical protein NQ317_015555 [Molorchus minor]